MKEVAADDPRFSRQISKTASSIANRLFGPSGEMDYRVDLASGGARKVTVVRADTGDSAADQALRKNPGWKVAYVGPASDGSRITDDMVGEGVE